MNSDQPKQLRVGSQMSNLTLANINGGQIQLSSYAGKKYILFMWASW